MKINKLAWNVFALFLFFAIILNSGCTYDYQGGPAHLEPLEDGIAFEIKFLLDAEKVVNPDGSLKQEVMNFYNNALPWSGSLSQTLDNVNRDVIQQYVDTKNLELWGAGWINRVRHHIYVRTGSSNTGDVQLTYRKRINIGTGTTITEEMVQKAILQAKKEGTYQWAAASPGGLADNVEIDWSYNSATLTLSRSYYGRFDHTEPRHNSLAGSKAWLINNFPYGSMVNFNLANPRTDRINFEEWYIDKFERGVLYGPASIRRHRTRGSISEEDSLRLFGVEKVQRVDIDIEVMPVPGGYIVELSSSGEIDSNPTDSEWLNFEQVVRLRQFMIDISNEAGYLIPENAFKTTVILETMRQESGINPED